MHLLSKYLRPHWRIVLVQLALISVMTAAQMWNPILAGRFIDLAIAGKPLAVLIKIAVLVLVIEIGQQILGTFTGYVTGHLAWKSTNVLRFDLTKHCLSLDTEFHKRHLAGEMMERIDGDIGHLAGFLSQFISQIISAVAMFVGMFVVLYRTNGMIALILLIFVVTSAFVMGPLQKRVTPYWIKVRESSSQTYGFLEERLTGLEDIRTCGAIPYVVERFKRLLSGLTTNVRSARVTGTALGSIEIVVGYIGQAAVALVTAHLVFRHAITIGTVYVIFVYMGRLFGPIFQLVGQVQSFQQALAGAVRVEALFVEKPSIIGGSRNISPGESVSVTFDRLNFAYSSGSESPGSLVLKDIAYHLPAGKVLGIVGRTGSGKTSLARLIFRLYDPTSGAVLINNHDIKDYQLSSLRSSVGLVTQDVQLFHASLRDNLTFYDKTVPDERLMGIIDELGLLPWYESLPRGLDTVLEPGGNHMSAGEAQLLALVRLFLKDPAVVVLDEASSRIDRATEIMLQGAIDKLLAGRTGIVIAHRLKTLERVDHIMVLEDGRIRESGPYTKLANDHGSSFFELLQASAAS